VVHFVDREGSTWLVSTLSTYTVRNVNRRLAAGARLTKCTGKPRPPPSMPKFAP
jgi:hypothetical protein